MTAGLVYRLPDNEPGRVFVPVGVPFESCEHFTCIHTTSSYHIYHHQLCVPGIGGSYSQGRRVASAVSGIGDHRRVGGYGRAHSHSQIPFQKY